MSTVTEDVFYFLSNIYLLVVAVVFAVLVLFLAIYILVYYQHPDDPDQSWWSKCVVLFSTWLVFYTPIFSAVDFAAVQNGCPATDNLVDDMGRFLKTITGQGGKCMVPTKTIIYFLLFSNLLMSYWFIPFSLWIRKDIVEMPFNARFSRAAIWSTCQAGIAMLMASVLWYFVGYTVVPVKFYSSGQIEYNFTIISELRGCIDTLMSTSQSGTSTTSASPTCKFDAGTNVLAGLLADITSVAHGFVSTGSRFFPYLLSLHTVVGWFVLSFYGGVGLVSFPFRHIMAFIQRPRRPLTKSEFIRKVRGFSDRAADIKEKCMTAHDNATVDGKHESNRLKRKFARDMALLEQEERLVRSQYPEGDDPERQWTIIVLKQYLQLLYGITGGAVSVAWIVQVYFYSISDPPHFLGLNLVFILTGNFFLDALSLLLLIFFCFHLTVCCIEGHHSVAMAFPCLTVHSLSVGITMIDTFLVQARISLLSAPAILAFQVVTLSLASANSNISFLYGFEFTYLQGWGFLMQSYIYLFFMLTCFFLTIVIGASQIVRDYMRKSKEKKEKAATANVHEY